MLTLILYNILQLFMSGLSFKFDPFDLKNAWAWTIFFKNVKNLKG